MSDKEVYFDQYCNKCKYKTKSEEDDPCYECLHCPVNTDSHKPVMFSGEK
jgi:hypothetical protein